MVPSACKAKKKAALSGQPFLSLNKLWVYCTIILRVTFSAPASTV